VAVAYSLVSSSILRFLKNQEKNGTLNLNYNKVYNKKKIPLITYSILWPLFLPLIIIIPGTFDYIDLTLLQFMARRATDGVAFEVPWRLRLALYFSSIWTIIIPAAAEILKVLAIAVVAIFLDAADVL
jgi:hypothetical protein